MTAEGHAMLQNELMHRQQVERPRIIQQIADARTDDGDLAENAEYHAAQELQEANESRIGELEDRLARAEVIDITKLSGDTVKFGATVTVIDEDREKQVWKIVGEPEADAKHGTISITSPLARALIGNRKGASVEVAAPGGTKAYKVQKVEWL
jgi:transcription elongation factor GreA